MKSYSYNGIRVFPRKEEYRNGTLAVLLYTENDDLFDVATVNLCHPLQSDSMAFLDENNLPGIGKWMEDNGLGLPMGCCARSGFCEYPLYTIFTSAL